MLPVFAKNGMFTTYQLARLIFGFSLAYCTGQFVIGALVDCGWALLERRHSIPICEMDKI